MHQFSLYGQVSESDHARVRQQLVGVTRMQPKPVQELHLIFKAQPPAGLGSIPQSGEASTKQDVQRIAKMLTANLYYTQLVGEVQDDTQEPEPEKKADGDIDMANGSGSSAKPRRRIKWHLEFKDTPDPGKQAVSGSFLSRTPIEDGDTIRFMRQFGYE